jgi:hypothetical protein
MISRISLVSKEAEAMDTTFQKTEVVNSIQVGQESNWDCRVLGELRSKLCCDYVLLVSSGQFFFSSYLVCFSILANDSKVWMVLQGSKLEPVDQQ